MTGIADKRRFAVAEPAPQQIVSGGSAEDHHLWNGCAAVGVVVLERAFLGEHWDYVVKPRESAMTLRVTTSPMDDFPVGASAWLEFEPRQMALIA